MSTLRTVRTWTLAMLPMLWASWLFASILCQRWIGLGWWHP